MKLRNKWEGISIVIAASDVSNFVSKQRWEGTSEETKVLVLDENVDIGNIEFKIGGFEYEVEMSLEESIQQIKNAKDICALVRDEIRNFTDFMPEMIAKVESVVSQMDASRKPDPTVEPAAPATTTDGGVIFTETTPVAETDLATKIKEGIAAALASMGAGK